MHAVTNMCTLTQIHEVASMYTLKVNPEKNYVKSRSIGICSRAYVICSLRKIKAKK